MFKKVIYEIQAEMAERENKTFKMFKEHKHSTEGGLKIDCLLRALSALPQQCSLDFLKTSLEGLFNKWTK